MQSQAPSVFFNEQQAAGYDERFAKTGLLRDALLLHLGGIFSGLPAEARILSVGAGTGTEILYLAERFPRWHFTAVEPAPAMLAICRRKAEQAGITSRCVFHEGFLDSLPPAEPFDAAASLFVSHFILDRAARAGFFRTIAQRLCTGGLLVSADLAADVKTNEYQQRLGLWLRLLESTPEQAENLRAAYARDVSLLPPTEVSAIIAAGGFEAPLLFFQTGLLHAWFARRAAEQSASRAENIRPLGHRRGRWPRPTGS